MLDTYLKFKVFIRKNDAPTGKNAGFVTNM